MPEEANVLHEEIIVHPTVERHGHRLSGEARIMGKIEIAGTQYYFERVVTISFKKATTPKA